MYKIQIQCATILQWQIATRVAKFALQLHSVQERASTEPEENLLIYSGGEQPPPPVPLPPPPPPLPP